MFTENIKNLTKNINSHEEPIDIICEGGAFLGFYQNGALQLIKELDTIGKLQVDRISGVSIGTINALLYFCNKLEIMDTYFSQIKNELIDDQQISSIATLLEETVENMTDEEFNNIQDKLYISYYDVNVCKQITVSSYKTRSELIESVYRSCFIPYFMKGHTCVERNDEIYCADGITPHIFQDFRNKKVLFLSIAQIDWAKHFIFMKNEHKVTARIMFGILDAYDFFHTGKKSKICSYLNNWTIIDYIIFYCKEYVGFIMVYVLIVLREIVKKFQPLTNNISLFNHFQHMVRKLLSTILIYSVQ